MSDEQLDRMESKLDALQRQLDAQQKDFREHSQMAGANFKDLAQLLLTVSERTDTGFQALENRMSALERRMTHLHEGSTRDRTGNQDEFRSPRQQIIDLNKRLDEQRTT